jgi:hypothetical protein
MVSGINITAPFSVTTPYAIDTRTQVDTYSDILLLTAIQRYDGLIVYVKDEGKQYWFHGGVTDDDLVPYEVGGSGKLIDFQPDTIYEAGQAIVNDGKIYRALTEFTSGTEFDPADWQLLDTSVGPIMSFEEYQNLPNTKLSDDIDRWVFDYDDQNFSSDIFIEYECGAPGDSGTVDIDCGGPGDVGIEVLDCDKII